MELLQFIEEKGVRMQVCDFFLVFVCVISLHTSLFSSYKIYLGMVRNDVEMCEFCLLI